uniref:Uncharacterized protein n=1 Tax=Rhizophora mucronata TaxID=61149 RepID=A0A2P2QIK8_RHIMU
MSVKASVQPYSTCGLNTSSSIILSPLEHSAATVDSFCSHYFTASDTSIHSLIRLKNTENRPLKEVP